MPQKLYILIGTRPNFIKVTQFKRFASEALEITIIHTGQHYDKNMADVFFEQFGLHPDHFLNIAPGSPVSQMADIMKGLEAFILQNGTPDVLMVPGDVNSTLAGALVANKMNIKLAHLESGLRSFDREMPEEINRILTDELADYYFVTEPSGEKHLREEGKHGKICYVGNTMIDTLVHYEPQIEASTILDELGLTDKPFVLITLHRPSNVDSKEGIERMIRLLESLSQDYKIVFPVHPRTMKRTEEFGLKDQLEAIDNFINVPPLGYFEFQKLVKHCAFVITDSGGIQEETTFRQVPCLTLRENTERPITCEIGTNTLVPFELEALQRHIRQIEQGTYKKGQIPELWDGEASGRILELMVNG